MDKMLWMLWFQGLENAPVLVQKCVESWKRHNPDWKIVFLDDYNLKEYVDIDAVISGNIKYITAQSRANVVRMHLLKRYGGVWVDVTCFCQRPLSSWLPDVMSSGFFAFRDPGPDRVMSNWFLASEPGCYLTKRLCDVVDSYWKDNTFSGIVKSRNRRYKKWLLRYSSENTKRTDVWFGPLVLKLLKVYPLYWFHYVFAKTVRTDAEFKKIWELTPYHSAHPIHAVQHFGQSRTLEPEIRQHIQHKQEPFYKLSWKRAQKEGIVPGSVLEFLFTQMER